MKRWLVWTCGGFVALSLIAVYALSPGRGPGGDAAASAGERDSAPSTPALRGGAAASAGGARASDALPPHAGEAPQQAQPGSAAAVIGVGPAGTAPSPEQTEALQKAIAEHQEKREKHRAEVRERARKKRDEIEHRIEQRRAQRAAFEAARPPDPNRPRPEISRLQLGPAVIPDPGADAGARQ